MQRPCRLLRPGTCDHGGSLHSRWFWLALQAWDRGSPGDALPSGPAGQPPGASLLVQRDATARPSSNRLGKKSTRGVLRGLNHGECKLS